MAYGHKTSYGTLKYAKSGQIFLKNLQILTCQDENHQNFFKKG